MRDSMLNSLLKTNNLKGLKSQEHFKGIAAIQGVEQVCEPLHGN